MRLCLLLGTLLACAVPAGVSAQGVLMVSQNKCALDKQGQVRRMMDTTLIAIAQELVNEGKLQDDHSSPGHTCVHPGQEELGGCR